MAENNILLSNKVEKSKIGDQKNFEQEIQIPDKNRGTWASKTEFFLSCMGYAVGLGNIWRFPYLCYRNGGGAFLIPYLLMLTFCGIPLYFLEMGIGQFSSVGCIGVFRLAPLLKGTGFAILVINFICACYCSVIISYPLLFLTKIFSATLPWMTCNNAWNSENCVEIQKQGDQNFTNKNDFKTAADEFFHNEILKITPSFENLGGIVWPLFWCLFVAWIVMYLCIMKGIKSVGKVVYFSATFPFVVLIVLFIRGVTLPGAMKGIIFYIYPDWSRLLEIKVWAEAALQIFFSLGTSWGGIVNMASFNHFRNDFRRDIILVPIINCSTSIFAGFVVFSVLGYLSNQTGIPIASVATNGPGLVFITYPQAIALLPWPQLWSAMFFVMLFLLGLDTIFVQVETIVSCISDEIPKIRKYSFLLPIILSVTTFLSSLIMVTRAGMYVLHLLDWYSTSLPLILVGSIEVIMVAWIYGTKNFTNDVFFMIGEKPHMRLTFCLKYVTPIVLIAMFFTSITFNSRVRYNDFEYPDWAIGVGWLSCGISIICIPLYILYILLFKSGSISDKFQKYLKPVDWAPASQKYRQEYENFKQML